MLIPVTVLFLYKYCTYNLNITIYDLHCPVTISKLMKSDMLLKKDIYNPRKYKDLIKSVFNDHVDFENIKLEKNLLGLLQYPQNYRNEKSSLVNSFHTIKKRKRSSNCSTKNGNLGKWRYLCT